MKYILVIGDGMADNAVPELEGKTPLEKASIPFIDSLAAKGEVGSCKTVPNGVPAGSDTAILSIFGNDPLTCYTGRSPLEAAGAGVKLFPGNVSYRCNMVAFADDGADFAGKTILSHNAGSIDGETSMELIKWLCQQDEFKTVAKKLAMTIHPTPSFRHIAVQDSADISGMVATPPHDILGQKIGAFLPKGCAVAELLAEMMEVGAKLLDQHPINQKRREAGKLPANGIWFWAEGTAVGLANFTEKYGVNGAVISAVPLVFGIAALGGLGYVEVEGATGELETNYEGKVEAALKVLKEGNDFVGVHIEAPDECTHNGDLEGKLQAIQWLDSRVMKPLCEGVAAMGEDYRLLLLSDHKTLTATRTHDGDPVPYLIYDSRKDIGCNLPYTEKAGEKGECVDPGTRIIGKLFEKE